MLDLLNAIALISDSYLNETTNVKKFNSNRPLYEIGKNISDIENIGSKKKQKNNILVAANNGAVPQVPELDLNKKTAEKDNNTKSTDSANPKPASNNSNRCAPNVEILLVDVAINLLQISEPIRVEKLPDGSIVIPELIFKELKLKPKSDKIPMSDCSYGYPLDKQYGITYTLDQEKYFLDIRVPVNAFEVNVIANKESYKLTPETSPPGFFTNYQLYATQTQTKDSFSGILDLTGFNNLGSLTTGVALNKDGSETSVIRTSSYYQKDLPDKMQSFVVGDTVNSDGNWSRAANFFGIRWSKNFQTQPGYIYTPNPIISGSAALPSVVDVYVNNQKTFSQKVNPGPFDITHLPVPGSGAGQVSLIIKDILGNEQVITKNFYQSPLLLAKGENDFSLESGLLRKNYGIKNNDYKDGFVSGTFVHGVTDTISARGRLELQTDRQAAGGDVAFTLGNFALFQATVASSNDDIKGTGNQYGLYIENIGQILKTSVGVKRFDKDFSQFASSSNEIKPKTRTNVIVSFPTFLVNNSINIGYVGQTNWDADPFKNAYIGTGFALPYGANISFTYNKRIDTSNNCGSAAVLTFPLGDYNTRAEHTVDPSGQKLNTYTVSTNLPAGPGMGWNLYNEDLKDNVKANVIVNSNVAQYSGEINVKQGVTTGKRISTNGSVGFLDGETFASRNINGSSFAMVKTGGLKDIKIYNQNNMVAISDNDGTATFPIRPYEKTKIEIKDNEIPLEASAEVLEMYPVAFARSGVMVKFPIKITKNALVKIYLVDDSPIPAGATVNLVNRKDNFIAGRNGEVYLTDLSEKNQVTVTWLENKCELIVEIDPKQSQEQIIGPLKCIFKD